MVPPGPPRGPVCVPVQVTSRAIELPLAKAVVIVPLPFGADCFHPWYAWTNWSAPWSLRWLPTSW